MKINSIIIKTFLIIILTIIIISTGKYVYASVDTDWVNPTISSSEQKDINNITGKVLGIVQTIATYVSVGILIVIGIKYIMGSVEEKSEMDKKLWIYVVGAIMAFATTTLLTYIYNYISKDF